MDFLSSMSVIFDYLLIVLLQIMPLVFLFAIFMSDPLVNVHIELYDMFFFNVKVRTVIYKFFIHVIRTLVTIISHLCLWLLMDPTTICPTNNRNQNLRLYILVLINWEKLFSNYTISTIHYFAIFNCNKNIQLLSANSFKKYIPHVLYVPAICNEGIMCQPWQSVFPSVLLFVLSSFPHLKLILRPANFLNFICNAENLNAQVDIEIG